jgi:methionyl aminopeptidase
VLPQVEGILLRLYAENATPFEAGTFTALEETGMSIESAADLAGMERAGKVTRAVLDAMKDAVRTGISTRELDQIGASVMRGLGGRSAPQLVYGFPGQSCISVNDEIVHGVPGNRRLEAGDLVKLDVTVEVDGYMADACESIGVGSIT